MSWFSSLKSKVLNRYTFIKTAPAQAAAKGFAAQGNTAAAAAFNAYTQDVQQNATKYLKGDVGKVVAVAGAVAATAATLGGAALLGGAAGTVAAIGKAATSAGGKLAGDQGATTSQLVQDVQTVAASPQAAQLQPATMPDNFIDWLLQLIRPVR